MVRVNVSGHDQCLEWKFNAVYFSGLSCFPAKNLGWTWKLQDVQPWLAVMGQQGGSGRRYVGDSDLNNEDQKGGRMLNGPDLITRKKLNAASNDSSPYILHPLGSFQRFYFFSPDHRPPGPADMTSSPVSCFTLWDILSSHSPRLGSLGLNNACDKNCENVPLRNEKNVARSFSNHFPGPSQTREREKEQITSGPSLRGNCNNCPRL